MGLSIKDHIDQGHYPTDEKGRALVNVADGRTVTVCATDCPDAFPIVAFHGGWVDARPIGHAVSIYREDGICADFVREHALLPPPPRKVKVTARIECVAGQDPIRDYVIRYLGGSNNEAIFKEGRVFELTGEYLESWS